MRFLQRWLPEVCLSTILIALAVGMTFAALRPTPARARDYQSAIVRGLLGFPNEAVSPAPVSTSAASARTATDVPRESYVRIVCESHQAPTNHVYMKIGDSTVTATINDTPLVIGVPEVFSMGPTARRIAFINDASQTGLCKVTVLQ